VAERGTFETTEKRIRTAYSKLGMASIIVGLVALMATIVGVVILLPAEKAEVAAQVLSNDELTMYPAVAELKGYFTYADEEVAHLWKVRVKFVNSGDKTVIGMGNQKNIFGEGLNFVFPDDTRILRIEEESETFESNVEQMEQTHFQIQFSQWRSGEYNIASFYIASEKSLEAVPCPSVPTRDIIDGDVIIQDLTEREPRERVAIIDRLPRTISTIGKIIGVISAGLIPLILIIMAISGWKPALRLDNWKKQHLSSFSKYLDQIQPALSEQEKKIFRKKPHTLPDTLWAGFESEKASQVSGLESRGDCIAFIIISCFLLFGLISLILMLIPV